MNRSIKYQIQGYKPTKFINEGAYGQVYEAVCEKTKQRVAIKVVDLNVISNEQEKKQIKREIDYLKVMQTEQNPNLIKMIEYEMNDDRMTIVLEYCESDLWDLLIYYMRNQILTEQLAYQIFWQLVNAISTLHNNNLMHRDIKFQNIMIKCKDDAIWQEYKSTRPPIIQDLEKLLKHSKIKLVDLGMGTNQIGDELHFTVCGTKNTMAPEVIDETGYSRPAEIYSIGVIFYSMLYHEPQFDIAKVDFESKRGALRDETINLVKGMLEEDPQKRITFEQLYRQRQYLHYSFIGNTNKIKPSDRQPENRENTILIQEKRTQRIILEGPHQAADSETIPKQEVLQDEKKIISEPSRHEVNGNESEASIQNQEVNNPQLGLQWNTNEVNKNEEPQGSNIILDQPEQQVKNQDPQQIDNKKTKEDRTCRCCQIF